MSVARYGATTPLSVVAQATLCCSLTDQVRGANLSRFVQLLNSPTVLSTSLVCDKVQRLLNLIRDTLESSDSFVSLKFPYVIRKRSPKSSQESDFVVDVEFLGVSDPDESHVYMAVTVPYTSCCPCSREISEYNAHNQRSSAKVVVELAPVGIVWIEEIIQLVESRSSSPIWELLKRPDEKYVTELMYQRPKFVEDVAREISEQLDLQFVSKGRVTDYLVICCHQESIHLHDVSSCISMGKRLTCRRQGV